MKLSQVRSASVKLWTSYLDVHQYLNVSFACGEGVAGAGIRYRVPGGGVILRPSFAQERWTVRIIPINVNISPTCSSHGEWPV